MQTWEQYRIEGKRIKAVGHQMVADAEWEAMIRAAWEISQARLASTS